ncbi:MAG: hypothetical protein M1814_006229 [Vezdaea aestivalis]|nr:MAG: hypothetical protein M1814_006229 [Vezdaea aestivalis]
MSDGQILKPDKDFSKEADVQIPQAEKQAKSDLHGALDKLYLLEKQTRQASDLASTSRVLICIITLCKDAQNWSLLNEQILSLSKKHGQLKQATTKMVQVAMGFLDDIPSLDSKLSVIEALRTVTEGKIFVEVERARVTRILSDIKKSQGDLKSAADILTELQVETFGSMERREKTEFILEQVELCISNNDWTQAGILSRKISSTKYFARKPTKSQAQLDKEQKAREDKAEKEGTDVEPASKEDDVTDLKLRFYDQQVRLAKHDDKYLETCKHYRRVLDTEAIENDPVRLKATLERVVYFIILSPHSNEQSDLLQRIFRDPRNAQLIPTSAALLKLFTVPELMRWPQLSETYASHLSLADDMFSPTPKPAAPLTPQNDNKQHSRYQALHKRVMEHNVRVVAKYYTRIEMSRLTALLDLDEAETEKYISDLVTGKTVYAKIDRPAGVVSFARPRDADDVLNEWSADMKSLLGLLERIDHLITKEEMMARIQQTPKGGKARA